MKKSLLVILCALVSFTLTANERTEAEAAAIAAQFSNTTPQLRNARKVPRQASDMRLAHRVSKLQSEAPAFYVFNQGENEGFVIVSGDDFAHDILVYSEEGSFDPEHINPNFRFWLNRLQKQISHASAETAVDKRLPQVTAISPLLKNAAGQEIKWDQETPYNNLCPMDPRDNTRSLTGCVATAMAQIMYKWQYPTRGTGSYSYEWEACLDDDCERLATARTLSANFGATTYDWANMKATYGSSYTTAQANAVATLMYHCGVACNMLYGGDASGSGSFTDYMASGAVNFFGYRALKYVNTMSEYDYTYGGEYPADFSPAEYNVSITKLTNYFNTDLEAGRPILMGGTDNENGGHEFVCDGRDSNGRFHINWGWSGDCNCYCQLSALRPSGESINFSDYIDALIGLEPDTDTTVTPVDPVNPVDPVSTGTTFSLITNASQLTNGMQVIIVNEEYSVAMSTNQKTNNRGQSSVTISNSTIQLPELTDVQILTLEAGTTTATYAFNTGAGYLCAAASDKNYLRTKTALDANGSWAITFSGHDAAIVAQGNYTRNTLRYNKASNGQLFSCYGTNNTQEPVSLYGRLITTTSALETVETTAIQTKKILRDGQLLIMVGSRTFNMMGQEQK